MGDESWKMKDESRGGVGGKTRVYKRTAVASHELKS